MEIASYHYDDFSEAEALQEPKQTHKSIHPPVSHNE